MEEGDDADFMQNWTFQGVASEQQAEIKRLRNEINRLSMFRSTVRNYQVQTTCPIFSLLNYYIWKWK